MPKTESVWSRILQMLICDTRVVFQNDDAELKRELPQKSDGLTCMRPLIWNPESMKKC